MNMELRKRGRSPVAAEAREQEVELWGRVYHRSQDVIAFLESVSDERERYKVQAEVLETMVAYHNRASDMIEEVFAYIEGDGAFRVSISHEEFLKLWQEARAIVENNAKRRDRLLEASKAAKGHWDQEVIEWLGAVQSSGYFMAAVRSLSSVFSVEEGASRVNRAIINRLASQRKGISDKRVVQAADFTEAKSLGMFTKVTAAEQRKFGLRVNRLGFLEEGSPDEIEEADSARHFTSPAREMEGGYTAVPGTPGDFRLDDFGLDDFRLETQDDRIDEGLLDEVNKELQDLEEQHVEVHSSGTEAEGGGEEIEGRPTKRRQTSRSSCGCSADVSSGWKTSVARAKPYEMGTNLRLLKAMRGFQRVCYPHAKAMGGHMGLRVKQLNAKQLDERLHFIHENRLEIGRLKTDRGTFSWFRVKNRPARASDALGPYKFSHQELPAGVVYDQQLVREWVGGIDSAAWERDGSINLNLFGWWFETEIGGIVLKECDVYRHHLREINGKSNYGWLRNMFYSIGQQLMRQDPMYYAAYAALRPDKQWRLVSYPYYAKFAVKGDNTYFRHIDLNIPELLAKARGSGMIQGSISLDDEDESNCTVILPGMHHKLPEWWERVVARGQETDGFVHRITEQMFTKEDAKALGVDWKRVPCRRGDARITVPQLPHGADGPSTSTRRTMLPWLVGVQDDLTTLEVVEGGTWEMLSDSHRDMVSPQATPSGLANRYGVIPYKFPAAVEITGLGPLSDALVCRRRWDSALVLRDRDILLCGDREQASEYVRQWRKKAAAAAVEAFALVVELEKQAFGQKSYFYHSERLEQLAIPFPEVEPDENEETDEGEVGGDGGCGADGFAEAGMEAAA
jgi:hypothetical protein